MILTDYNLLLVMMKLRNIAFSPGIQEEYFRRSTKLAANTCLLLSSSFMLFGCKGDDASLTKEIPAKSNFFEYQELSNGIDMSESQAVQ